MYKHKKIIILLASTLIFNFYSCTSNAKSISDSNYIHEIEENSRPEKGDSFRATFGNYKLYYEPNYMVVFDEDQKKEADNLAKELINSIRNDNYKAFSSIKCLRKFNYFLEKDYFNYLKDMFKDSEIKLFDTMHFDQTINANSVSSEYGDCFFNPRINSGFKSYNYLYTINKNNVTHTFTISIALDYCDELKFVSLVDGYKEIDSKSYEDWLKEAVVLCQQEKYIPAMMRFRMAIKNIPSNDYLKPKFGSMASDLFNYLNKKTESPLIITTPDEKFEVIYIKPEYWKNEQNFGYAIYYKSKFKYFFSQNEKIKKEAKTLHEEMLSKKLLDSVGHYTYVPQFSDEKPKEVYNQKKSIIFESDNNFKQLNYMDLYVNFGQAFEHTNRASKLFADANLENYICSLLKKTPKTLTLDDLKNIKHLDLENVSSPINSLKGISKLINLEYLDIGSSQIFTLDEIGTLIKLKHLDISYTSNIDDLSALKNLENLEYLDITKSYTNSINSISNLKKLKTFNFLSLRSVDTSAIGTLLNLENVALGGSKNDIDALAPINNQIKNLKFENLEYHKLNFPNLESMETYRITSNNNLIFKNPSKLKTLEIDRGKILDFVEDLTNLESLTLSSCNLEDIDFLENNKFIKHLDLSSNDLSDLDILENFPNLEYLDVHYNSQLEGSSILKYLNKKIEVVMP